MKLVFLIFACFVAAFVDAVAGGGGLISIPAYIISGVPSHFALGTNKFASSFGTMMATSKFAKEKKLHLPLLKFLIPMSLFGAVLGVSSVLLIDPKILTPLVMILVLLVGVYTSLSKNFGEIQQITHRKTTLYWGMFFAWLIGFYDGFFGPGAGTFLVFVFIKIFGFDFLCANANAKPLNLTSNLTSLLIFAYHKKVIFSYGIPIALAMMLGGYLGAKVSIKNGSKIIKPLFIAMSLGAFIKLFLEYVTG